MSAARQRPPWRLPHDRGHPGRSPLRRRRPDQPAVSAPRR